MTRRWPVAVLLVAILAVAIGSLVSGAEWVEAPLLPAWKLPAGNLLAAFVYISSAALTIVVTRPDTLERGAAWVLVAAAVAWLPLSIGLAGNLNLNFGGGWQAELWMFYTYKALPLGCLLLLVWQLAGRRFLPARQAVVAERSAAHRAGDTYQ